LEDLTKKLGYKIEKISSADLASMKDSGFKAPCCIISSGYYNGYQTFHQVRESDLQKTISLITIMINKLINTYDEQSILVSCGSAKCSKTLTRSETYFCYSCISALRAAASMCKVCKGKLFMEEEFYYVTCSSCRNVQNPARSLQAAPPTGGF
jgi:hypothetical protein